MNINITAVTPETANVNGQELARSYVESILLPLMVASKGQNHAAIIKVAQAFDNAGLSLEAIPEASRIYRGHLLEQQREKERLQAEARANAERCREPSRQEIAEYHAEKERKAREIREHFARVRTQRA
ncbi:hypothetical protein N8H22_04935 [Stutzerimonas stutzeri]|uniref:hypothetical protein n=1 Tax=Stutzerimonas sp. S1 TaxID=3030652 RepID=UPI000C60EEB0|nr:hypothetical protein [Stutzerimonas sp. S1]MBK59836.1 hypothetical protein [Pseudomonas sp.]MCW3147953.1 hypothetical protein [Stutzerimonas sp. S1]|tara:strand:+ start:53678 stop:54061 length:384 start_codon:yes stop_codon:yes gene_type:complete